MSESPAYGTPPSSGAAALACPKCRGAMRTYERNGLHIDQCETCRGIFLDFGELESLIQLESRLAQPPAQQPPPQQYAQQPPPQQYPQQPPQQGYYGEPGWGQHGSRRYRRGGLSGLFFSS